MSNTSKTSSDRSFLCQVISRIMKRLAFYCHACHFGTVHCRSGLQILILNGLDCKSRPTVRHGAPAGSEHLLTVESKSNKKWRSVPTGTRPCITRYKRTESAQCRDRPASRQGRDTKRIKQIHQKRDEKVGFLSPHVPFWHSTLSQRMANPYTQWVWIANPDQRYGMEPPLDRDGQEKIQKYSLFQKRVLYSFSLFQK